MLSDVIHTGLAATHGGMVQVGGSASNPLVTGDIMEEFLSSNIAASQADQYPLYFDSGTANMVESFFYIPDQTQYVYKWIIQIPFILDVNAYSSGNFNLGGVQATLYDLVNNNKVIFDTSIVQCGFTNMANTGIQIAFLRFVAYAPYKLIGGNPIKLTIKAGVGGNASAGIGTYYFGYLPLCPDTLTAPTVAGGKNLYPAVLGMQIQGTPDHNYTVLADPKYGTTYDYGGVAKT